MQGEFTNRIEINRLLSHRRVIKDPPLLVDMGHTVSLSSREEAVCLDQAGVTLLITVPVWRLETDDSRHTIIIITLTRSL